MNIYKINEHTSYGDKGLTFTTAFHSAIPVITNRIDTAKDVAIFNEKGFVYYPDKPLEWYLKKGYKVGNYCGGYIPKSYSIEKIHLKK